MILLNSSSLYAYQTGVQNLMQYTENVNTESIYILFAKQYAEAKDVAVSAVWGLVMGTVTASGIPEAIAAAILVLAIGKVLLGVFRKMNIGNVAKANV